MDDRTTITPHAMTDLSSKAASHTGRSLRRRGLMAGAAALIASAVAAQPIAATGPLVGTNGSATQTDAGSADGVQGYASGASLAGVFGRNNDLNGLGVAGAAPSGIGVAGSSGSGPGISGVSTSGPGAVGVSTANSGLYGTSQSYYGLLAVGAGSGGNGIGAYTTDPSAYAAYLTGKVAITGTQVINVPAGGGHGLYSTANTGGSVGVYGVGAVNSAIGVYGYASASLTNAYAGVFTGATVVSGAFTVVGGPKNAAVPHPDGSYRVLYCVESPESWFEDFGHATLSGGSATVTLDPDFAAVVLTSSYHVFLSEYGDHQALYVSNRTTTGFTVTAKGSTTATGSFSYRVVAKRKDIAGPRLAHFTAPAIGAAPTLPTPMAILPGVPQPATPPMASAPTPITLPTAAEAAAAAQASAPAMATAVATAPMQTPVPKSTATPTSGTTSPPTATPTTASTATSTGAAAPAGAAATKPALIATPRPTSATTSGTATSSISTPTPNAAPNRH